jgi:Tol biopolymer transport system component
MAGCPAWLSTASVAVVNAGDEGPDIVEFDLHGIRQRELNFDLDHVEDIAGSPDGSVLVVEDSNVPIERGDTTHFASKLYLASGDGTGLRPITPEGRSDTSPSWSPDGRNFVVQSSVDVDSVFATTDIWVVTRDGSSRRVLSPYPGRDRAPVWVRP